MQVGSAGYKTGCALVTPGTFHDIFISPAPLLRCFSLGFN
jgi:hypothetical protein